MSDVYAVDILHSELIFLFKKRSMVVSKVDGVEIAFAFAKK
ncbi:MAG: hypothetical protein OEV79_11550 [candidate division WOR-3 bacterium]|nr:hypothetical protein [candidate division WOR-3 bacterium]